MNKYALIVLITFGVIGIAVYAYLRDNAQRVNEQSSSLPSGIRPNSDVVQPLESPHAILYSDSGFSPNPLRVKVGTIVTFVNNSSHALWPASGVHPTHTAYPTTGGCIGSTFDACRSFGPGETWDFQFDKVGSWSYHNHMAPQDQGTIIVE